MTELRLAQATTIAEAQTVLERFLPRFNARFRVPGGAARAGLPTARPRARPRRHSRLPARAQPSPATTPSNIAGARSSCCPDRSGPATPGHGSRCWSAPAASWRCATRARPSPRGSAPPRAGVLRERRSALARQPALERIASGLGFDTAPPGRPELAAAANGTAVNGASPQAPTRPLRPPTPRQQARWKAIRQAQLQGLSMRATARLLGISRNTIRRYVRDDGPPGRRGAALSAGSDQRERTDSLNS